MTFAHTAKPHHRPHHRTNASWIEEQSPSAKSSRFSGIPALNDDVSNQAVQFPVATALPMDKRQGSPYILVT
jgi:hypothetical protein